MKHQLQHKVKGFILFEQNDVIVLTTYSSRSILKLIRGANMIFRQIFSEIT